MSILNGSWSSTLEVSPTIIWIKFLRTKTLKWSSIQELSKHNLCLGKLNNFVLLSSRCSISILATRSGMGTLPTGDRRPTSLLPCTGTRSHCPTAVPTTQRGPTPTLEGTRTPSLPCCHTLRLVLWSQLPLWPTSWLPLELPAPSSSLPTASPTQQALFIRWQWVSTPGCCLPLLYTPRASSSPCSPRTLTLLHPLMAVSLSALPK